MFYSGVLCIYMYMKNHSEYSIVYTCICVPRILWIYEILYKYMYVHVQQLLYNVHVYCVCLQMCELFSFFGLFC